MSSHVACLLLAGLLTTTIAKPIALSTPATIPAEPIIARQDDDRHDTALWCETLDVNDPDAVAELWESTGFGIGAFLDQWTQDYGMDKWLTNLTGEAFTDLGDAGIGACGTIGGTCTPNIDCVRAVDELGEPETYWILRGVAGLQNKLNIAHEYLQDETLETFLSLSEIASDFSAPPSDNALALTAGIISSALFVVGGVAGGASVVASEIGVRAAARIGAANSLVAVAASNSDNDDARRAAESRRDNALAVAAKAGGSQRVASASSAGTYLLGSIFSTISASTDEDNQVESSDLESTLKQLFSQGRDRLELIGKLATGRGDNYAQLPHSNGSGVLPLYPDGYVAGFFSDGRMLLGEGNEEFNSTIEAGFSQFKTKVVDTALQTAGFKVFAITNYDTEEECLDDDLQGGYGAHWMDMDDGNTYCMKLFREGAGNNDYDPAEDEIFDKLEDKYDYTMTTYYKQAYLCNKAKGDDDRTPDLDLLPEDGTTPLCWYGIEAKRATINSVPGAGGRTDRLTYGLSNFE